MVATAAKGGSDLSKRSTPIKNRRTVKDMKKNIKKAAGWYITSALLNGLMEIIFITMADKRNDAYFQPLVNKINSNDDDPVNGLDIIGCFRLRIGVANPAPLLSPKTGYQRRAFLRYINSDEMDDESRLENLNVIKAFLEDPENNQYETPVFIEQGNWDVTKRNLDPLANVDHHLVYADIKRLLEMIFGQGNVDHTFAQNDPEQAAIFFTENYIPFEAAAELGFPPDKCLPQLIQQVDNGE